MDVSPQRRVDSKFGIQPWILHLVGLLAITAAVFLFVWFQYRLLFVVFAGLLFAVVLQAFAAWIERRTGWRHKYSYTVVVLAVTGLIAGIGVVIAPRAIRESGEIAAMLPHAIHQARSYLEQRSWGQYIVKTVQGAMTGSMPGAKVANFALLLIQAVEGLTIIVVVGFFGALAPHVYARSLVRLLPVEYRQQGSRLGSDILYTLRWWLVGQLIPMAVLGALSMVGLWLLHVPLAFTLGLFTGAMIFVPYVGALLSGIPAILIGLTVGPGTALSVLVLYSVVHIIEGYILTPLVQKKAIRLPPLLTILSQLLMWSIGGFTGVLVATPMAAVALVLVKTLYLKEQISRRTHLPNAQQS